MRNKIILLLSLFVSASAVHADTLTAKLGWADVTKQSFVVDGLVTKILVTEGMRLSPGFELARLEQKPFLINIQKKQAGVARLTPQLFDAKLELDRAKELFDRTVLSEIELQKVEVIYKGLLAEKAAAQADLALAQYQQQKSILTTSQDTRVVLVSLQMGDVLNNYTQADKFIELASNSSMLVWAKVSLATALELQNKTKFSVQVANKNYVAVPYALRQINVSDEYLLTLKIDVAGDNLLAGMAADIEY